MPHNHRRPSLRTFLSLFACAGALSASCIAAAEPAPAAEVNIARIMPKPVTRPATQPAAAIARAIENLAHDATEVRAAAESTLLQIGPPAYNDLVVASGSTNPQVAAAARRLCEALLHRLEVRIDAPTTTLKARQPLPILAVTITNTGVGPVTILKAIDNADSERRPVLYGFTFTDAAGNIPPKNMVGKCGNVNPILPSDMVTLQPGESYTARDNESFIEQPARIYAPLAAGAYSLRFEYRAHPADYDPKADKAPNQPPTDLSSVWPCDVFSNTVTFKVE